MFVDGDDQFVERQLQLLGSALHDADVGLVRDEPVEIGFAAAGLRQHRSGRAVEDVDRQLENRRPVHLEQRVASHLPAGHRARHTQDADMAAIGVQGAGQDARLGAGLQHHRTGTVAEQHTGGAVVEVEDAREDFGADHQCATRGARADHRIGHRQRIHEA